MKKVIGAQKVQKNESPEIGINQQFCQKTSRKGVGFSEEMLFVTEKTRTKYIFFEERFRCWRFSWMILICEKSDQSSKSPKKWPKERVLEIAFFMPAGDKAHLLGDFLCPRKFIFCHESKKHFFARVTKLNSQGHKKEA